MSEANADKISKKQQTSNTANPTQDIEQPQHESSEDNVQRWVNGGAHLPPPSNPNTIKQISQLQALIGNRATGRLLRKQQPQRQPAPLSLPLSGPVVQRDGEYDDRPPSANQATVESFAGRDAMGEYLAASSRRMMDAQTEIDSASPANQEEAEQYEDRIENLVRLNAIGLMASHKATVEERRSDMFSTEPGQPRMQPLRDAATNVHRMEEVLEMLEEYQSDLRRLQSDALFHRGDLSDALDELGRSSNRFVPLSERQEIVERYRAAQRGGANMLWLFVYGTAQQMHARRERQVEGTRAALSTMFQNFPVLSQLDASTIVGSERLRDDDTLAQEAGESFARVLQAIDDTIRGIHSSDIDPLDMPKAIEVTQQSLPGPLQTVLTDMKNTHEQIRFWLTMGLTAAEVAVAFIPVIGPALALGIGAGSLVWQGEQMMDRMLMQEAEADEYGEGTLGVVGPSAFEQTMFVIGAILTAVGLVGVLSSLRGGRAAMSAADDLAGAAGGVDNLLDDAGGAAGQLADDVPTGTGAADDAPTGTGATDDAPTGTTADDAPTTDDRVPEWDDAPTDPDIRIPDEMRQARQAQALDDAIEEVTEDLILIKHPRDPNVQLCRAEIDGDGMLDLDMVTTASGNTNPQVSGREVVEAVMRRFGGRVRGVGATWDTTSSNMTSFNNKLQEAIARLGPGEELTEATLRRIAGEETFTGKMFYRDRGFRNVRFDPTGCTPNPTATPTPHGPYEHLKVIFQR